MCGARHRRVPVLAAVACTLVGASLALRTARAESAVQTAHVVVEGDVPVEVVGEASALVEALWPHLVATFRAEPPGVRLPLEVRLFTDRAAFVEAATAAGMRKDLASSGGWTSFEPAVSYVAIQPEPFDTRRLVLHETVHQYQARLVGSAAAREPSWHHEGLAEWFGWHRRTAGGIVFGAMDAVALRNRPRAVAKRVAARRLDAWAIATGRVEADYTDALGLVAALRATRDDALRTRYARWSALAVRGAGSAQRFGEDLALEQATLAAAVRETWADFAPPWTPLGPGWDEEPAGIAYGRPEEGTLVGGKPCPGAVARCEARVLLEGDAEAAVAIGVPERDEWVIGWLGRSEIRLVERSGGVEESLDQAARPTSDGEATVTLRLVCGANGPSLLAESPAWAVRLGRRGVPIPLAEWGDAARPALRAKGGRALFSAIRLGDDVSKGERTSGGPKEGETR